MKTEELFSNTVVIPPQNGSENSLAVGTCMVDFEITGILGEGGFGIVYLAIDHSLQRTVAIKEYMPGTLAGRGADGSVQVRAERHKEAFDAGLKSFINEARLLAQFDHPSLVKVYRFWEQNQTAYMAMRYYDGQTLKDIVLNRPEIVTEAWLKFIFKQILEALDTLYRAKVLHRDVSPDNIIVQKNGDAVLLDFGSARQIIGDMTQGLTVILKPGYAPVEQYSDDASMVQGPWTDIYALAAVMYFAIVKSPPVTSVARMIKDSLVLLQDGVHVGFSYKFLVAIDKGLALQPGDRPQSMDEFRRLLGIAAFASSRSSRHSGRSSKSSSSEAARDGDTSSKTLSRTRREITQVPVKPAHNSRTTILAGILAALALLASGYYAYQAMQNGRDNPPAGSTDPVNASKPTTAPASVAPPVRPVTPASKAPAQTPPTSASVPMAAASTPTANVDSASKPEAGVAETASAKVEQETPPAFTMRFNVTVKPWGAVWVDGKQIGVSPPMKKFHLPEGKHQIKIINPAFPENVRDVE
ncbi:MAG: hypothetical protein RL748_4092, partial [Pseudomonadota bacterium]